MKKIILNTIIIGLISLIIYPLCTNAKNISTLNVTESNKKVTISGKTKSDVLAIAVLVYSNDTLIDMETCNVNDTVYSCKLNNSLDNGEYLVKVANYNGGTYLSKDIKISDKTTITTTTTKLVEEQAKEKQSEDKTISNSSNPKTFDEIIKYSLIASISILCGGGIFILKKRLNN